MLDHGYGIRKRKELIRGPTLHDDFEWPAGHGKDPRTPLVENPEQYDEPGEAKSAAMPGTAVNTRGHPIAP